MARAALARDRAEGINRDRDAGEGEQPEYHRWSNRVGAGKRRRRKSGRGSFGRPPLVNKSLRGPLRSGSRQAVAAAAITLSEAELPSASPFSKSPSITAIWFVTWAKHKTGRRRARANGIKRRRLHLDGEYLSRAAARDGCSGLAKRRVGGPAARRDRSAARLSPMPSLPLRPVSPRRRRTRRRQIVIARAFVAQRTIDQHEIGRRAPVQDLSRRGHADQKPAARNKQLFCDEHREQKRPQRSR